MAIKVIIYSLLMFPNFIHVINCPPECNCSISTVCRGGNYATLPDSFPLNMESLLWNNLHLDLLDSSGPLAAGRVPGLITLRMYNLVLNRVSKAPFQWLRLQLLILSGCCFSEPVWSNLSMNWTPPSATDQIRIRVNMGCKNQTRFSLTNGVFSSQVNQLDLANNCLQSINAELWLSQKKLNVIRLDGNVLEKLDLRHWKPPSREATLLLRNMSSLRVVELSGQEFSKLDLSGTSNMENIHKLNCTLSELNLAHQKNIDFTLLVKQFCKKLKKFTISHIEIFNYMDDVFLRHCPPSAQLSVLTIDTASGITKFPQLSHFFVNQLDVVNCNLTDETFVTNGTLSILTADVVDLGGNLLAKPLFHFTSQVLDLSLAKNRLQSLVFNWLSENIGNRTMKKLNFSSNPMTDLFDQSYETTKSTHIKVKKLVLENLSSVKNRGKFPQNIFHSFSHVQDLYMRDNNLKNLTLILDELRRSDHHVTLERLYLQNNRFFMLQSHDFHLFSKLIRLDLSRNHLREIQKDAFLELDNLLYLDLSDNRLLSLTVWLPSLPIKVHTLKVAHNPLSCACSSNTTRDALYGAIAFRVTDARCTEPLLTIGLNYFSRDSENVTLCGLAKEPKTVSDSNTNSLLIKLFSVIGSIVVLLLLFKVVHIALKKNKSGFYKPVKSCMCDVPKSTEILRHTPC